MKQEEKNNQKQDNKKMETKKEIQFAKEIGFEKILTTKIENMNFEEVEGMQTYFLPMSKYEFFKEHVSGILCWWNKEREEFFEGIDELIDFHIDEWEEFVKNTQKK